MGATRPRVCQTPWPSALNAPACFFCSAPCPCAAIMSASAPHIPTHGLDSGCTVVPGPTLPASVLDAPWVFFSVPSPPRPWVSTPNLPFITSLFFCCPQPNPKRFQPPLSPPQQHPRPIPPPVFDLAPPLALRPAAPQPNVAQAPGGPLLPLGLNLPGRFFSGRLHFTCFPPSPQCPRFESPFPPPPPLPPPNSPSTRRFFFFCCQG